MAEPCEGAKRSTEDKAWAQVGTVCGGKARLSADVGVWMRSAEAKYSRVQDWQIGRLAVTVAAVLAKGGTNEK